MYIRNDRGEHDGSIDEVDVEGEQHDGGLYN